MAYNAHTNIPILMIVMVILPVLVLQVPLRLIKNGSRSTPNVILGYEQTVTLLSSNTIGGSSTVQIVQSNRIL